MLSPRPIGSLVQIFIHQRFGERERDHPIGTAREERLRAFLDRRARRHHIVHQHYRAATDLRRVHHAERALQVLAALVARGSALMFRVADARKGRLIASPPEPRGKRGGQRHDWL